MRTVGYFWGADPHGYLNTLEYSKYTHLIYCQLNVTSATNPALVYGVGSASNLASVKSKTQAASCKISICLIGGDWVESPDKLTSIMNNSTYRAQLVTNLVNFVNTNGLDGVDIDWETSASHQSNFNAFLSALRAALPGKIISVTGPAEWANPSNQWFSVSSVNSYVDFVNLMMYDIRPFPESSTLADIQTYTQEWLNAGFNPAQLNLGIPAFGYSAAGGIGDYSQIIASINPANNINSTTATTPWTTAPAEYWWSGYNLNQSKVQYAQGKNLGGIMIYVANEDACGNTKSIISAVSASLSTGGLPAGSNRVANLSVIVIPAGVATEIEIWLGPDVNTKIATSGRIPFTSTGVAQQLAVPITMPSTPGTYNVFIDLYISDFVLTAYEATSPVVVVSGTAGQPTWQ